MSNSRSTASSTRPSRRCEAALALDPDNEDARSYLEAADRAGGAGEAADRAPIGAPAAPAPSEAPPVTSEAPPAIEVPAPASGATSFADGRYEVTRFLGEGGRKIVYLAKDTLLDRDVAFALIKTDGLDDAARERITREAQTMGRLGSHPNVVAVFDIGEHTTADGSQQPFVVIELLGGGDVEGLLEDSAGPLPLEQTLEQTLEIAKDVTRGLEFIHSKSIIHRDMKPGNVWLTADGQSKIGDYGLALSGDKTRLTVEGSMVGTVDYMPPEQALGGEITPRSDLYSLGAMLYELTTGSVPFAGDRMTEVISQHINTAPELPSRRGAVLPPALEELILRLMSKDPENRPASATEVLRLLETIDPNDTSPLDAEYLAQLAQGVFVGRSRELKELRERFDEAVSGISRLVVLVGQPGIGKTRLARELETYARTRGAQVFWGRAPEGGGAPPYWLFQQGLRHYLELQDDAVARQQLGEDASVLARIAPEIAARLPGVVADPEGDEFALHEALRRFFNRLGEQRPILVILDDLHWADSESLAALQHISRDFERAPLMIVGTYRDTEMSRSHPLSQALATFNREPSFVRIQVRGLDRAGVGEFIERSAGFEPSREQLDLFMRETDGNPFFLSETVAAMLEAGTLDDRTYDLATPDGVREALSRRVNELPEDAVELLKLAAIAGYEFDFTTLSIISDVDENRQLELIETALDEHVIAEGSRPGTYRFVYKPMQRVLLDEMSSTRRLRFHGTIAEQLEQSYGPRAEEHASELARHYAESAALNPAHVGPALRFSVLAGEQAEAARDWLAANQAYAQALRVAESSGGSDAQRAGLLAALGRVEVRLGLTIEGRAHLDAAIDSMSTRSEPAAIAAAALSAFSFLNPRENVELAHRALSALNGADPDNEARLLAWIATAYFGEETGESAAARAHELAESRSLSDVQATLGYRDLLSAMYIGDLRAVAEHADQLKQLLPKGDERELWVRTRATIASLQAGDLSATRRELEQLAEAARDEPGVLRVVQSQLGGLILLQWDLDAFQRLLNEPGRLRSGVDTVYASILLEIRGQVHAALAASARAAASRTTVSSRSIEATVRSRQRLLLGDDQGAEAEFAAIDQDQDRSRRDSGRGFGFVPAHADEAFLRFATPETIRQFADRAAAAEESVPIRATPFGSFDRTRATWAIALEEFEEAERLARAGLEWTQRERCPVEEGRCHQLLADILERRGEAREAAVHLDAAGDLFSAHGARLYLDQVLEKKDLLKA